MRLDVSDLFDHLYDVVSFARARFNLSRSTDSDGDCCEWTEFCNTLSDRLFLPACAKRAFDLTHFQMSPTDVKPRVIAELSPETGKKIYFYRYIRPYFVEGPRFFAAPNLDEPQYASTMRRPKHKLMLWLGKLPPEERALTPPPYAANLDAPIRYYARQYFSVGSHSPCTVYFEFHGDWLLRDVYHHDASFVRSQRGGQWRQIDELTEISQASFEAVWAAAVDRPT